MIELNAKEIIECIKSYPVVTFDVFDTLIKRDVKNFRDIVNTMESEYTKSTGRHLPVWFLRERIHAPKIARKKYSKVEVSLNDIYDVLHCQDKELLAELECSTEIKFATKNPVLYEVYEYCLKAGKKIYAISDMYLPTECIIQILQKCGYKFENVYVSQEFNTTKRTGNLFDLFLKENKFQANQVIHIGDNLTADVYGAEKAGIQSVHIPNKNTRLHYYSAKRHKSTAKNVLYKYINNRLDTLDTAERVGYEILGPILYYFTTWIHRKAQENNIKKLFFLSRDGYLIMKAYEELYSEENAECRYLLVSSNSVKNAYENLNSQKELLTQYLRENNMYGTCAVIDIGWSGRLHKMLADTVNGFVDLYGFYFGTFKLFHKNVADGVSGGFLRISKWKRAQVFMNAGFIEILFSDTLNGTTERYELEDNKIIPVTSEPNPNGSKLRKIQNGALQFVKDWDKSGYTDLSYSSSYLIKPLLQFSMNPKSQDLEVLMDECVGSGRNYEPLTGISQPRSNLFQKLKQLRKVCWKGAFISHSFPDYFHKLYEFFNPILVFFKV